MSGFKLSRTGVAHVITEASLMMRFRALVIFAVKAEALAYSPPHRDVLTEQADLGLWGRPHLVVAFLADLQIRRRHQTDA
jgi:hypothetical protein